MLLQFQKESETFTCSTEKKKNLKSCSACKGLWRSFLDKIGLQEYFQSLLLTFLNIGRTLNLRCPIAV